ncbi:MAG: amidohydrolase [Deltaproteobacteria bacterium]|nr:amidohydrolase [Deltaproteobacteria bacterium]
MEIINKINGLQDELIGLRRDFHRYPELGYEEYRTANIIEKYLRECGMEVKRMTQTGVVGWLRGCKPGSTLMLRADMDALPLQEATDVPYRSVNPGKMHGCGHDGHMAMLLIAARILARYREVLPGNIVFAFEPNEENVGALAMIEEGLLEDPRVDACLGIHLWSTIDIGRISVVPGPVMAGMDHFEVVIKGRGGHTSAPQFSVDPILAAANVIQSVQAIQTREIDALKPTVIMFGRIQGGSGSNIIAEQVRLEGTIRYLYEDNDRSPENPKRRFSRIVTDICRAHQAEAEVSFPFGHPVLTNDASLASLVRDIAVKVLGAPDAIVPYVSMAGEDFSEFAARRPAAYYFVGCRNEKKECFYPHHHPRFNLDEDALRIGAEMHVRTTLRYFRLA